jgi:hypothetical protein
MTEKKDESKMEPIGSKQVSISLSFNEEEVTLKEYGPYTAAIIKRGVPLGEPGQPALPWRKFYISVPWDAVLGEVSVERVETKLLAEKIIVEPAQPDVPTVLGQKVEWVAPDLKLYASKVVWPEEFVRGTTVRRTGGFALAELEVCPFRYHLPTKKLELVQQIDLSLSYTQTGQRLEKPRSLMALRHEQKFVERVQKMVLNPKDVDRFKMIEGLDFITDMTTYPEIDYVIITSSFLASKFQRLAHWRILLGLRARVVTIEDIKNNSVPDTASATFWQASGYTDGGTRDMAEAIRNFIKWASVNWLTDYILLGGDTEWIPCRQAIHSDFGSASATYGDIDTPDPDNQLNFSTATASSTAPGTSASNVLDGDEDTVWRPARDSNPWIRVSVVGGNVPVNQVKLTWGTPPAPAYEVQVSADGETWTSVHTTGVHFTSGTESIGFSCHSASYVRLLITSSTDFALASLEVYGPERRIAYARSGTVTRIYLKIDMSANPSNSVDGDLVLIEEGPQAGTIIPYNESANDTTLGWHFVEDLVAMPGTVSTTRTRYLEVCGPAQYHGQAFVLKRDGNYIPADLYYADITAAEYPPSTHHDWDANDNEVYGERYGGQLDGVNGLADVTLGRAPVETHKDVNIFIDKVIGYERFVDIDEFGLPFLLPSDFAVSVLLGSKNWGHTNTPGQLDKSARGKEDIRHSFLKDDDPSRWNFTRLYEDAKDVPAADQTADLGEASKTEILNAIRAGNNVVSLSSHGSYMYLCYLYTKDIEDVVSYPAIFYGNACYTNKFDLDISAEKEAFGEWTILNPQGAAVAYVGNSRTGSTIDNPYELAFWKAMLDSGRLGDMFNECKQAALETDLSRPSYNINLLGDPAMRVWSDRPKQLSVTHSAETCTGSSSFQVTVSSGGNPVKNALVCVTIPATLFATGRTNGSGIATLTIDPFVAGIMRVTVSGKNLIPYFGSVTVKKCADVSEPADMCGFELFCRQALACPKLQFFDVFEHIYEIWGYQDLDEFVKQADTPEIKVVLDQLPAEVAKPIRMMLDRIRNEATHE